MMMGAGAAVKNGAGPQAPYKGAPVLAITGDAGIAFSIMELDTASKYKIPVIAVVYNNNAWGVWPTGNNTQRSLHMYLFQENLRYDVMATALGARGEYVQTPEDLRRAEAGLPGGSQGQCIDADQLSGAQRIQHSQDVPAGCPQLHRAGRDCYCTLT